MCRKLFMCCEQYAGQSQKMKIGNKSFQNVSKFKHLGITLSNIICIHEETESRKESLLLWFRIFCFPIYYLKAKTIKYTGLLFCLFCMGVEFGPSLEGRNIDWVCPSYGSVREEGGNRRLEKTAQWGAWWLILLIKYDQDHQMKNDKRGGVCALHRNHMKQHLMYWYISSGTLQSVLDSVKCPCFMCSVWMSTLPNCQKGVMDLPLHLIKEGNVTESRHTILFRTFCEYDWVQLNCRT